MSLLEGSAGEPTYQINSYYRFEKKTKTIGFIYLRW